MPSENLMGVMSVAAKSLRDQRWQIIGFGVALGAMAMLDVFIWPTYRDQLQNFEVPPALQAFIGRDFNIAEPAGFLATEFFSWVTILLIVYAIIQGTGAIAGEEGSGAMDLLLAQPLRRRDLVLQKTLATFVGTALIIALGYVGFVISMMFVDMSLSLSDVALACGNMLPITMAFFTLSLWLGALMPSRSLAAGTATGITTMGYFIYSLANGVESLRDLQYATPFYYYGSGLPLIHGIDWWHVALLTGVSLLFVALALRTFEHRDVTVGGGSELKLRDVLRRAVA